MKEPNILEEISLSLRGASVLILLLIALIAGGFGLYFTLATATFLVFGAIKEALLSFILSFLTFYVGGWSLVGAIETYIGLRREVEKE